MARQVSDVAIVTQKTLLEHRFAGSEDDNALVSLAAAFEGPESNAAIACQVLVGEESFSKQVLGLGEGALPFAAVGVEDLVLLGWGGVIKPNAVESCCVCHFESSWDVSS